MNKSRKKDFFSLKGFTLVELMVVITILATIGAVVLNTVLITLRTSIKTNTINEVRQVGTYTISQLSKTIRNAKSFQGVSTDGTNFRTNCVSSSISPVAYEAVKITTFDGNDVVFSCAGNTIASDGASLINTASVQVASCTFYCAQRTILDTPTIGIDISLTQFTPTGTHVLNENTASASAIPFQTTVLIRNVSR